MFFEVNCFSSSTWHGVFSCRDKNIFDSEMWISKWRDSPHSYRQSMAYNCTDALWDEQSSVWLISAFDAFFLFRKFLFSWFYTLTKTSTPSPFPRSLLELPFFPTTSTPLLLFLLRYRRASHEYQPAMVCQAATRPCSPPPLTRLNEAIKQGGMSSKGSQQSQKYLPFSLLKVAYEGQIT